MQRPNTPDGRFFLSTSELCKKFGLTDVTIRKYEKDGILSPSLRTGEGDVSYKWYDEKVVERLGAIRLLRELNYPLKEAVCIVDNSQLQQQELYDLIITRLEEEKRKIEDKILSAKIAKLFGPSFLASSPTQSSFTDWVTFCKENFEKADNQEQAFSYIKDQLKELCVAFHRKPEALEQIKKHGPYSSEIQEMLIFFFSDEANSFLTVHKKIYVGYLLFGDGYLPTHVNQALGPDTSAFISKALFYSAFSTIFELTSEYRQQYVKMQDEKAKQIYTRDVIQELSRKLIQELSRSIPNVEEMIQEEKTRLIGNLRQLNYYPANIQEAIEDAFEKCFLRSNTIISPEVFDNWFDFFRDNMLVT